MAMQSQDLVWLVWCCRSGFHWTRTVDVSAVSNGVYEADVRPSRSVLETYIHKEYIKYLLSQAFTV